MAPQIVKEIAAMDSTKPSQKSLIAQSNPKLIITVMSQGRPSISNQQELDCLLNSLFKLIATETPTNGQCSQFPQIPHKGHPTPHPLGQDVKCLLWVYVLYQSQK